MAMRLGCSAEVGRDDLADEMDDFKFSHVGLGDSESCPCAWMTALPSPTRIWIPGPLSTLPPTLTGAGPTAGNFSSV